MPNICVPSLKEESLLAESALTTETQERATLPGLVIEANRIMRGTISNQSPKKFYMCHFELAKSHPDIILSYFYYCLSQTKQEILINWVC